VVQFEAVTKIL